MNEEYKPITNLWKDSEGYRYFGTLKLSSKIKYDGDDFIPLWEWFKQLQQENERLNGAIQTYDILLKANVEENQQLKEEKRKVRDYINKHCVNEKISKEVGYKCYTMADTNELEKIMKILGDKE